MKLQENTLLRDYNILQQIGEGGMGTVYLAEDTMLERKVALKILNPLLTKDVQFIERFRQEAKLQSNLIHPNIVALHNFFIEDNYYCMALEYVDGITLKEVIKNTGPIPEERALKILRQLLDGLKYAHARGVIHRDIKPSNIIIDCNDNVKIMDFGIAKILGDKGMTKTGTKMGTIYYMSPEQIRAEKDIDNRTDIYSLGVTYYEMLTGHLPFNADTESDFEIMSEIVKNGFKNPREYYPFISEKTINLLRWMTEGKKEERMISADEGLRYIENRLDEQLYFNRTKVHDREHLSAQKTTANENIYSSKKEDTIFNEDVLKFSIRFIFKTFRNLNLKSDCTKEELSSLPFLITKRASFVVLFTLLNVASWVIIDLKYELITDTLNSLWESLGPFWFSTLLSLVDSVILGGFQWLILRKYFSKGSYKWIIFIFIALFLSAINSNYLMDDKFIFKTDNVHFYYGVQLFYILMLTYFQLLVVKKYAAVGWKKFPAYFLSIFSFFVLSNIEDYIYYAQFNNGNILSVGFKILRTVIASMPMGLLLSFIYIRLKALPNKEK